MFTEEQIDEMVRLYVDEGMSTLDIAERFGCSRVTICNRLNERGVMRSCAEANRISAEDPEYRKKRAEGVRRK